MSTEMMTLQTFEITLGGRKYTASQLSLKDLADLRTFAKQKKLGVLIGAAKDSGTPLSEIADALANVANTGGGPDGVVDLTVEDNIRYMVYLALRRNHRSLKLDELDFALDDLKSVAEAIEAITVGKKKDAAAPNALEVVPKSTT